MRVQKNLAFSRVAISIVASCAIFLVSTHGEAQNSNTGKPEPFTIEHTVLFPLDSFTHVPPAFSNGASEFLDGCGSWEANGAIDDQGKATAEETFFFGPLTPSGFGGLVGESDTFESNTNDSFVIDYMILLSFFDDSHEGSCVFKGGTGNYSNLHGGNCKVSGTFSFVFEDEEPDPNCFNGTGCPTDVCIFVDQTFTGKIAAD